MQINGFSYDEFACPVCKSINNSLMPSYPIDEVIKIEKNQKIDQDLKKLMDFYIDFFDKIIKNQKGYKIEGEEFSLFLRNIYADPEFFISHMIDHFTHRIFLTDIRGIDGDCGQILNIIKCFRSIVRFRMDLDHDLDILKTTLEFQVDKYVKDQNGDITSFVKILFAKSLVSDSID
jgi:hypothetical protein